MKNQKILSFISALLTALLSPLSAPQSARAADYYFDLAAINYLGGWVNLSESLSYTDSETGQTRYFWFSDADMTNPLTSLPDFSNPGNNYTTLASESYTYYGERGIIIDTDFNASSLTVNNNISIKAASADAEINVANIIYGSVFHFGFMGSDTSLSAGNVMGNNNYNGLIWLGNADSYIKSFDITGTLYVKDHTSPVLTIVPCTPAGWKITA